MIDSHNGITCTTTSIFSYAFFKTLIELRDKYKFEFYTTQYPDFIVRIHDIRGDSNE